MSDVTLNANLICKNGTASNWKTKNPILLKGEMGVEIDTGKFKFGDGISGWNDLEYTSSKPVETVTVDPSGTDYGYDIGQIWVNTATGRVYVLISNVQNAAVWKMLVSSTDYANEDTGGAVRSSTSADKVKVEPDGTMSLNTISGSKVSGTVASANKLETARTIALAGDVTASATSFDGSANVSLTTVLKNVVAAGTGCKVTVNAKGLVTKIEALTADDIPKIPHTKVTGLGTASTKNTGLAAGNVVVVSADGKIDSSIMPAIAITDTFEVATQAGMLALNAQQGDVAIRSDVNKTYILKQTPATTLGNWAELKTPTDAVLSVNGKTGAVTLTTSNITEGSNLYYTEARATSNFNANFTAKSSAGLTDGSTILHSNATYILNGGNV